VFVHGFNYDRAYFSINTGRSLLLEGGVPLLLQCTTLNDMISSSCLELRISANNTSTPSLIYFLCALTTPALSILSKKFSVWHSTTIHNGWKQRKVARQWISHLQNHIYSRNIFTLCNILTIKDGPRDHLKLAQDLVVHKNKRRGLIPLYADLQRYLFRSLDIQWLLVSVFQNRKCSSRNDFCFNFRLDPAINLTFDTVISHIKMEMKPKQHHREINTSTLDMISIQTNFDRE